MPTIKKLYTSSGVAITAPTDLAIEGGAGLASSFADANNYSITATIAANALTIALKSAAGTDCTGSDYASFGFRSATAATGTYSTRTVTTALSLVVPQGANLGLISTNPSYIYVYAIDNAGTVELAVSTKKFDDASICTSTTISTSADSATVMYSTTGRSNVGCRLICRLFVTQTSDNWGSVTEIALGSDFITGGVYGLSNGLDVPAGQVGERQDDIGSATHTAATDIVTLTFTAPGIYLVSGASYADPVAGANAHTTQWKLKGTVDSTKARGTMRQEAAANADVANTLPNRLVTISQADITAGGGLNTVAVRCTNSTSTLTSAYLLSVRQ